MRFAIAGLAAACVVGVSLAYHQPAMAAGDAADWRQQELRFLRSVLGRVKAELEHAPSASGIASLRREEQEILDNIAAVEKSAAASGIPAPVAPTPPVTAPAPPPAPAAAEAPALRPAPRAAEGEARALPSPQEPVATASDLVLSGRPAELRPGGAVRLAPPDLAGFEVAPELRAPPRARKAARKPPEKAAAEKPVAEKPDRADRAGDAEKSDKADRAAKPAKPERADKRERAPAIDRSEAAASGDRAGGPDRVEKTARADKSAKSAKPESKTAPPAAAPASN